MNIGKSGNVIQTIDEWFLHAPPKQGKRHWVDGRSAKELARAWCAGPGPCVPAEMALLLASRPELGDVEVVEVFPERLIAFDTYAGEPRNADLAIRAENHAGPVAITVEAKADEPFGDLVPKTLANAVERRLSAPTGRGVERVQGLVAALLPPWRKGLPDLGAVRYQLLTGVGGTLAWAKELGSSVAVFVVHEFVSSKTKPELHRRNARDLDRFVKRLTDGKIDACPPATLLGPFPVRGDEGRIGSGIDLFIGKIATDLRSGQISCREQLIAGGNDS